MALHYPPKRYLAVSLMVAGLSLGSFIGTRTVSADDHSQISNPGSGLPEQPSEPAVCVNEEQQAGQNREQQPGQDRQKQDQDRSTSQQRHDELVKQLNDLNVKTSDQSLTDAERKSVQSQMDSIRSEMTSLEQQVGQSDQQPSDDQHDQGSQGSQEPSDACKAAIVQSAQTNLGQYKNIISTRIVPALDRVDSVANTVEASISHFQEIGVPEATITKITNDIAALRANSSVLRGFFQDIVTKIDTFLSQISNPGTAFNGMKNGFSVANQNAAAKAGDDLVATFSDLQSIIGSIKD